MTTAPGSATGNATEALRSPRTSEILRAILSKNPGVEKFTIQRILASIGNENVEASLMMFSLPAVVPVRSPSGAVAVSTGVIGYQLFCGQKKVRLPRFLLRKTVSRRALAVAIHAALPLIEAAEKVLRPRWRWVDHAPLRRALGLFVLVLALALAYPLFGFNALHATSIFVMALGMAEHDGLAVLLGAAVGLLSLVLLATSGFSARALRAKAGTWFRKLARKLSVKVFARFLHRHGHKWLARALLFQWSKLLLLWDPERAGARSAEAQKRKAATRRRGPQPLVAASGLSVSSSLTELRVNGTRKLAYA